MERPRRPLRSRRPCRQPAAAVLLAGVLLAGCALPPALQPGEEPPAPEADDITQADAAFYWPYAALATDVYRSRGEVDANVVIALSSPWLREEVHRHGDKALRDWFSALGSATAVKSTQQEFDASCKAEVIDGFGDEALKQMARQRCERVAQLLSGRTDPVDLDELNRYANETPARPEDCSARGGHTPLVPVGRVREEPLQWSRVPELRRDTPARGSRLFVPDLAIDVWRRPRGRVNGVPVVEYAIVYRGTVGGGGWVSNLRGLTAFTPFIWDQYSQALDATNQIVAQIRQLHRTSDALFGRGPEGSPDATQVLITSVGHSLGAGLAQYVYLRVPALTRAVGFDPSPIDGTATVAIESRPLAGTMKPLPPTVPPLRWRPQPAPADDELARRPRRVDRVDGADDAAIHLLHEHGEFLSRLAKCSAGPVWGAEGGPRVRCNEVNYSSGNPFRQHNMAELACRLYLRSTGVEPREKR